jgi:hypothetical protein
MTKFQTFLQEMNPNNWVNEKLLGEPFQDEPNQFEKDIQHDDIIDTSGYSYVKDDLVYLGDASLKYVDSFFIGFLLLSFFFMALANFS